LSDAQALRRRGRLSAAVIALAALAAAGLYLPHLGGELLAPVYDWFTEGFDTADLKGAKELLKELN
jgi:hypothetical protein